MFSRPPWRWRYAGGYGKRYPEWRYLIDGDGRDENLKDYPIEQNPELTIRSVIHNPMAVPGRLGCGKIKHSLDVQRGGLAGPYCRNVRSSAITSDLPDSVLIRKPSVIACRGGAFRFIALDPHTTWRGCMRLKGDIVARGGEGGHRL